MKLRCIIIDDEPLARSRLRRQLMRLDIEVVAEGCNGQEALDLLLTNDVELLFIDIQMPVMDGLQAVREIESKVIPLPTIIYCTAYDEHALQAFDTNAAAYLLKPTQVSDIQAAIEKARTVSKLQMERLGVGSEPEIMLTVHYRGAFQRTSIKEFTYFHSVSKSVFATLVTGEQILVDETLKSLEERFDSQLVRIHRGTLVNKSHLYRLVKDESGGANLELSSGASILKVSRRHLAEVKKCFE